MLTRKIAYQLVLIEFAKIAYEIHSRDARKVRFEIHKRSGKFVVYFDDSVYKDINFQYGFTLAKELYSIVSGKKDSSEIERDMNEDKNVNDNSETQLDIPLFGFNSIQYKHQNKPGEIFEVSIELKQSTPYNNFLEKLEVLKEKANDDDFQVLFSPEDKEGYYNKMLDVEDINLKKLVVYYEDGDRYVMNVANMEKAEDFENLLNKFTTRKKE